jgi:hypothetical protein
VVRGQRDPRYTSRSRYGEQGAGSLKHFFNGTVTKVNIHTPAGLDAFVDHLDGGAPIILADMGAGAGQVAADWFESMHEDVAETGVRFTAVGVVTPTRLASKACLVGQVAFGSG